jgi:quercetin dioxygenase-like cupin family protein
MWMHTDWSRVRVEQVNPLLERQVVPGEKVMVVRWRFKKGCVIPLHHHPNEQISIGEEGTLRFLIDGKEVEIGRNGILCIPSNVPHQAEAIEDAVAIDIFTPPREDFLTGTDDYLRR